MTLQPMITGVIGQQHAVVRMQTLIHGNTTHNIIVSTTINAAFIQMSLPHTQLISVAREAVLSLLDARDFLGYQLSHAKGSIGDQEFGDIASDYLGKTQRSDVEALVPKVRTLVQIIGDRADTDTVSTVFNCEIEEAEAALNMVSREIDHQQLQLFLASP